MVKKYDNIGETLYSETLANGLAINVVTKPGFNKSYAFFATNYGGADRRFMLDSDWIDSPAGVAHFLEHKLFDMPNGENALAVLSANGASPNAFTSSGMTAYFFESTQGFYKNLESLLSFVSTPYFTPESVQKEQGIIAQEIGMNDDSPFYVAYYNLLKTIYAHHPVRDSVAGTVESISEITEKTLYACHKVFYNPSNMTLCVVGDVDPDKVVEMAKDILPREPGLCPDRDYGGEEQETPSRGIVNVSMEVSAPYFIIGSRVSPPETGRELLKQTLTAKIALSSLLGRSSNFYTRLYAQGLLNDSFGVDFDYSAKTAMFLCDGESPDPEKVFEEIRKQIQNAEEVLDEDLFNRVKKASYGRQIRVLNSFEDLCRELAEGQFAGYCILDAVEIIESITFKDVLNFIEEALTPKKLAISVIFPKI